MKIWLAAFAAAVPLWSGAAPPAQVAALWLTMLKP